MLLLGNAGGGGAGAGFEEFDDNGRLPLKRMRKMTNHSGNNKLIYKKTF